MTTKKKKNSKNPHLAFHNLIMALSYWGSATRVGLIAFFAVAVFAIQVVGSQVEPSTMTALSAMLIQAQLLIYVVVSFFLLDVGYVTIARKYSFTPLIDRLVLFGSEIVLGLSYFLPYFIIVSDRVFSVTRHVFIATLCILSARLVIGMLYGNAVKR